MLQAVSKTRVLVICGPTASGKSELAVRLARHLDGEIITADSMQVYRGLDIGTAKPTMEERQGVIHHLLDVAEPDEPFSAADYVRSAGVAIMNIASRGKRPLVAGGTGLYIRALLKGLADSPSGEGPARRTLEDEARRIGNEAMLEQLRQVDPESAGRIHPNNLVRIIRALEVYRLTGIPHSQQQKSHGFSEPRYNALQIGINTDRRRLDSRIAGRVEQMFAQGFAAEVQGLLDAGYTSAMKPLHGIGYREMIEYLSGKYTLDEAGERIRCSTRQYARRQMTWFSRDDSILWLEYPENFATIADTAFAFFEGQEA